ncbi:putative bifunctional diguanylate cyclase/phosphodiesterase [Lysobacter korlensis]|uniref:Bifunctional diguanylate cyclase/phosphodiesterase n=1 Tax=Lysobacter korlensis TaxID=553636 RepID=A0ABV6RQ35_9GAMM
MQRLPEAAALPCGNQSAPEPRYRLRLRVDGHGRVLGVSGDGSPPASLAALVPALDEVALQRLLAAARSVPGGRLRIDASSVEGQPLAVWIEARPSDAAGHRVDLADIDFEPHYRERLEQRLVFERLIASLSTELIHASPAQIDALIEQALGRIGQLFAVDRAYLFRFNVERTTHSNTHEWVEEGVSREASNLQDIPVTHFPWLMQELLAGREVHVPVVEQLPDEAATERAEFTREGIRSVVLVPFGDAALPDGFIGFDSVRRQRHWPSDILLGLRLVGQMFANAFRSREMADRLTRLAFHDPLTGLGNRRFLHERLALSLARVQREDRRLAVILIDLDDFKLVNDSYGHSVGDEILTALAARLTTTMRAGDIVARLGGDEFVVVVDVDDFAMLSQLIERLFAAMAEPVELRGLTFALRLSVGVAIYPDDAIDAESLLRQADAAMYSAKSEGRNRFAFFTPSMTHASRESLRLRHELRLALERDEIRPHYQPRVSLPSMKVIGFEALARWNHPKRGLLLPGQFLGLAQHGGVIGQIDLGGLRHALANLRQWRMTHPDCRVSVNLDAQALQSGKMISQLEDILHEARDLADGIEIEITESSLMRDIEQASQALDRLIAAAPGLHIAIDDFGIGYSSLAYLGRLPVTTLKIDRSFIADLGGANDDSARAIIQSIIGLGHSLGLHIVAEGVETREQADELCELGCREAQGFLFSAALPDDAAARCLDRLPASGNDK